MGKPATMVWVEETGDERIQHVYFRCAFELDGDPAELERAELLCFVEHRYRLRVNGAALGVGPLRGYPEAPSADRYDLRPHLRRGRNVIAVHACHDGAPSFHFVPNRAGFIAWGSIVDAAGSVIDLATAGLWRARRATGYDPEAPCYSFAQPPIELLDLRRDEPRWDDPDLDDADWPPPLPVADQDAWGDPVPRELPPLDQLEREPRRLLAAHATGPGEVITSFRLCRSGHSRGKHAVATSWLHSPQSQTLTIGTYWGSHFINGRKLEQQAQRDDQQWRQDAVVELRAGWNLVVIRYGLVGETWDMHLALPDAGLTVSAERRLDGGPAWRVSGIYAADDPSIDEDTLAGWSEPQALALPWEDRAPQAIPVLPTRHLGWTRFGDELGYRSDQLRELRIPAGGGSLVLDMGGTTLGRWFLEYTAPAGTALDLGGSEELRGDRPWHDKMVLTLFGDRVIADGHRHRFESLSPRGLRYAQLTVAGNESEVVIHRLGLIEQTYPHRLRADFACSDPMLSELWRRGWPTLRACSEDVYTDCPWRERTLYGGDLLVAIGVTMALSGDLGLARRCLELFLQSQDPERGWFKSRVPSPRTGGSLSDFPLLIVLGVAWYHRASGDDAWARRWWPQLRSQMAAVDALRLDDGLYASAGKPFIDHLEFDRPQVSTPLNALIATTWRAYARLAEVAGDQAEAARARELAREDGRRIVAAAWSDGEQSFRDGLDDSRGQAEGHHPIVAAWTALFADPSADQAAGVLAHLRQAWDAGDRADPERIGTSYSSFSILGACYRHGFVAFAERWMREAYAPMLDGPSDTIWEGFDSRKSLCHVWACAPTFYLTTRALGVRLGFPEPDDLSKVLIAPESERLTWARGTVPHPRGPVHIAWRIVGDRLLLDYQAPEGIEVTVSPRGRLAGLQLVLNQGAASAVGVT